MNRSLTVSLSRFSYAALSRGEEGEDPKRVEGQLAEAVRFYLAAADAPRPGWSVPTALRAKEPGDVEVELSAEPGLIDAVEREAGRQDVSLSQLVRQAALFYAAELDAGRITKQILEDLD